MLYDRDSEEPSPNLLRVEAPRVIPNSTSTESPMDKKAGMSHEEYTAAYNGAADAMRRSQNRVDEIIIAGGAGALVLSTTFLERIAPHPGVLQEWLLGLCWAALLASLGSTFSSHATSARAQRQYLALLSRDYENQTRTDPTSLSYNKLSLRLNVTSFVLFLIGMSLLAVFAFVSISFTDGRNANDSLHAANFAADSATGHGAGKATDTSANARPRSR
jgi:hypothetical protein